MSGLQLGSGEGLPESSHAHTARALPVRGQSAPRGPAAGTSAAGTSRQGCLPASDGIEVVMVSTLCSIDVLKPKCLAFMIPMPHFEVARKCLADICRAWLILHTIERHGSTVTFSSMPPYD